MAQVGGGREKSLRTRAEIVGLNGEMSHLETEWRNETKERDGGGPRSSTERMHTTADHMAQFTQEFPHAIRCETGNQGPGSLKETRNTSIEPAALRLETLTAH